MTNDVVCCGKLEQLVIADDVPLDYNERFRQWSLQLISVGPDQPLEWKGVGARQRIDYCPACGRRLPLSLRTRFVEEMDKLGIEWADNKSHIPEPYLSDQWWREAGL